MGVPLRIFTSSFSIAVPPVFTPAENPHYCAAFMSFETVPVVSSVRTVRAPMLSAQMEHFMTLQQGVCFDFSVWDRKTGNRTPIFSRVHAAL